MARALYMYTALQILLLTHMGMKPFSTLVLLPSDAHIQYVRVCTNIHIVYEREGPSTGSF